MNNINADKYIFFLCILMALLHLGIAIPCLIFTLTFDGRECTKDQGFGFLIYGYNQLMAILYPIFMALRFSPCSKLKDCHDKLGMTMCLLASGFIIPGIVFFATDRTEMDGSISPGCENHKSSHLYKMIMACIIANFSIYNICCGAQAFYMFYVGKRGENINLDDK